jgi:UDP-2,4-diacetamido-2,4,6-trideoxy-beta-L-altropyranose hydrolase
MSYLPNLVIRADASTRIGTGHVMRCLALAQAWQDAGGQAIFVMVMDIPALTQRLETEGMHVLRIKAEAGSLDDAAYTIDIARQLGADWLVIDGYHFDSHYQYSIKDAGLKLLCIDDISHLNHYYADIILNQNLHAEDLVYSCESNTRLLLGTKYVLLRREFLRWQKWEREISEVTRNVLVTMGGSDPDNVTSKVIRSLKEVAIDGMEAKIVLGGGNLHLKELRSVVQDLAFPVFLETNVRNMPEVMAWADVAVSAGGITCWELAFMRLPSLIITLTDNQRANNEKLAMVGSFVNLGWHTHISYSELAKEFLSLSAKPETRAKMASLGRNLVDGDGIERTLMHLRCNAFYLRHLKESDGQLLWKWANDPDVRAASFLSNPVEWDYHIQWFQSKLTDNLCQFYIAINDTGNSIGQVRYDIDDREAVISISLDSAFRGKGYGTEVIRKSSQKLFSSSNVEKIHAYVKPDNMASVKAFMKAGFKLSGTTVVKGQEALHFVLARPR